jgi:hypothetical protein
MYFLFNLLRFKGLYIFQALLANPQEALNKQHLCVLGQLAAPGLNTSILVWPTDKIGIIHGFISPR